MRHLLLLVWGWVIVIGYSFNGTTTLNDTAYRSGTLTVLVIFVIYREKCKKLASELKLVHV